MEPGDCTMDMAMAHQFIQWDKCKRTGRLTSWNRSSQSRCNIFNINCNQNVNISCFCSFKHFQVVPNSAVYMFCLTRVWAIDCFSIISMTIFYFPAWFKEVSLNTFKTIYAYGTGSSTDQPDIRFISTELAVPEWKGTQVHHHHHVYTGQK